MAKWTLPDMILRAETARADRAEAELRRMKTAIAEKGGNEHAPTQWAYDQACEALRKHERRADRAEAKLAKAVADMKALTDVSTLMQSSASHDRFKHNTIVTDSIWSQWSRQLKFARTTFAKLTGGKDE